MTLVLELCDAIASRLKEKSIRGEFGPKFEAARHYQPRFKLGDLERAIKVCVVPTEVERSNLTRDATDQLSTIQIGVLSKIELSNHAIDPLVKLVDDIALDLDNWQIDDTSIVTSAAIAPIFDQDLLKNNSQFTSIITLTVRSIYK